MKKIKVLHIDDSTLMCSILKDCLADLDDIQVVGIAIDPINAWEQIRTLKPDLLTLDVEMPRMSGLEFLEKLMRLHPLPVIMISTHTLKGSDNAKQALELGAVDIIPKMRFAPSCVKHQGGPELIEKIREAVKSFPRLHPPDLPFSHGLDAILPARRMGAGKTGRLIAVGASTGGTEAIKDFLKDLPVHAPAVLVVQHMPEMFTKSFAQRLDALCKIKVKEAQHGERILAGHAYIAPGHSHLMIRFASSAYFIELSQGPAINRHRPSVDVLFRSLANCAGANALGVILTGMGKDGAAGLLEMKQAGAHTWAQDEASCVVFGMPKEAIMCGAVDDVVPLKQLGSRVMAFVQAEAQLTAAQTVASRKADQGS